MALTDPDTGERPATATVVEPTGARRSRLRRVLRAVWATLGWTLVAVGAVLAGAALWIRRTFGAISVDQMLMNAEGGGEGAPSSYLTGLIWQAVLIPLGCVLLLALLWTVAGRRARAARSRTLRWARALVPIAAVCAGTAVFAQTIGLPEYVRSMATASTMEDYYVVPERGAGAQPAVLADGTGKPKNLVVIVLESGETAYSDDDLFEINMNEPVEEATADWQRFDSLETYGGGGWTMAGLVGTECGVPLRGPGRGADDLVSNEIGEGRDEYLPGAVCLGDVLQDAGYTSVFMGGADASFSSKEKYLRSHGYDEVRDLRTWLAEGETDVSEWALSDHRLMERAKEEVTRLHDGDQPFHLTLLTVDPHEPLHQYEYCPSIAEEPMESVIHCSMTQVAGFIDYMRENGYLEDTAVMITGDHRKMIGEDMAIFSDELLPLEDRPLFNRLWDPEGAEIRRSSIDQLSVYATLLDVMHLGRPDHRAGIGVSALVDPEVSDAAPHSITALTAEEYDELIRSRSTGLYRALWSVGEHERAEAGRGE